MTGSDARASLTGERAARVALSQLIEPGDGDLGALVRHGGAERALAVVRGAAPPPEADARWKTALARWAPRQAGINVEDQAGRALRCGAVLLTPGDARWPNALDDLGDHAPVCLWVRGDPALLASPRRVAIVGARAASGYGEHVAAEISGGLALSGAVVISGAAYGIDGVAHRAALGEAAPTVAVLAGGADRVYPAGHTRLLGSIAATGAVVGEVPLGSAPTRWRFLLRNRVIAALAEATVVVEAGWRSGSLNTAAHAASLGRPLGAVPGPVTSPSSAGCHRLLRDFGAVCVTNAAEVAELLPGISADARQEGDPAAMTRADRSSGSDIERVFDALTIRVARTTCEIAARAGLAPEQVEAALGFLLLEGRVESGDAGWRRVPGD